MVNAATEGDAQAVSDCLQHLQGPDIDCTEQYNVSFYHDYFEIKSQ